MADQSSASHDAMFIEQVKRAQQLEAQRQKDPRAIEPLIQIYEWMLSELVANDDPVGIPAGFLLAGAPCVIGSLWSVPDISTAMLMEQFYYQHLHNGKSIAAALREAQRWLRHLDAESIAAYATKWYRQADQRDTNKEKLLEYMTYYRGLADEDPTRSLFAHPYYWAAFTVNGI